MLRLPTDLIRSARWAFTVLAAAGQLACDGQASMTVSPGKGPGGAGNEPPGACREALEQLPSAQLRRLTPEQYLLTVRDLFHSDGFEASLIEPTGPMASALEVEKLSEAAIRLVATKGHHAYVPCAVDGAHDAACMKGFIEAFGRRAFRRPLRAEEVTWLTGVYDRVRQTPGVSPAIGFRESVDAVAEVILQSPQFLYLLEEGTAEAGLPLGVQRLTSYERASRLSFMLWNSAPDQALMEAAAAGKLDTVAGVRAQAERLLGSPRARQAVRRFAGEWLGLDATPQRPSLENIPKNTERYPFDNAALRVAMREESEALFERVFFDEGGNFRELMTSTRAYVNGPLARLYGVTGGPSSETGFEWVDLNPTQRAGLFTRAAFLTQHAGLEYQSPIRRGVQVYRHALCQELGDPPPNANDIPAAPDGQIRSIRIKTEHMTQGTSCQSCHSRINPIGFTLEHYDAMGGYQTHDTGTVDGTAFQEPINASAQLQGVGIEGTVHGGVDLSKQLADSALARDCMARKWFSRAVRRSVAQGDQCTVSSIQERFRQSGDVRALLLDIISSPPLLYVRSAAQ